MNTQEIWGIEIALDLFFGGMAVGTFLLAVLINFFYGDKLKRTSKVAAYLSPVCVLLGFLFLISHLGMPERFHLTVTNFNVTSPISWGVWLQGIFFIITVIYALMWYAENNEAKKLPVWMKNSGLKQLLGFTGIPFAVAVGVYHGFFLMVFEARPLWNAGPVVVMSICGFIMTGIALVVFIMSFKRVQELLTELKILRNILGVAILLQLFTIALWISSLYFGDADSHEAMLRLLTEFALLFWGGAIILGLVLPLVIGGLAMLREQKTKRFYFAVRTLTSLMVLAGGFILRYVIIIANQ